MTPTVPTLETPRLILRPLALSDAPAIQARFPRWEIVRLLESVVPWPYPKDGALTYIRTYVLPAMQQGIAWHWSLRTKQTPDTLIGAIALRDKPGDNRGFWLDPDWQGQGLMTEASNAVTDFWFGPLDRPLLQVMKAATNIKSRRISERTGMRMIQVTQHDFVCGRLPTELWEITQAEWKQRLPPA